MFIAALMLGIGFSTALKASPSEMHDLAVYLGQRGYGAIRALSMRNNREVIGATINGHGVVLIVDTGCGITCLSSSCARRTDLTVHETNEHSWSVEGEIKTTTGRAPIGSLALVGYELNRLNFVEILQGSGFQGADGLLGLDLLKLNSAILPIGEPYFLFKPGKTAAAPIGTYMIKLGYIPILLHYTQGQIRVSGSMNGQPFEGVVDCGAAYTIFDYDFVTKVHGGAMSNERLTMIDAGGRRSDSTEFLPHKLSIGPLLMPFPLTAQSTPIFARGKFSALIGYDQLAAHQAIIDLGSNVLWVK